MDVVAVDPGLDHVARPERRQAAHHEEVEIAGQLLARDLEAFANLVDRRLGVGHDPRHEDQEALEARTGSKAWHQRAALSRRATTSARRSSGFSTTAPAPKPRIQEQNIARSPTGK